MRTFRFAIDRGGTFTDVYAEMDVLDDAGRLVEVRPTVTKLLSEDPANYPDAPRYVLAVVSLAQKKERRDFDVGVYVDNREGIRRVLEDMTRIPHPRGQPVDTSRIQSIRMGKKKYSAIITAAIGVLRLDV